MKRVIKRAVLVFIVMGLIGASVVWYQRRTEGQAVTYQTVPLTRGNLLVSISATGTVEPEEVVDVGAQVAGQILSFGKDVNGKTVDYGSIVSEGTVLARIDDSLYAADAAQAEAQVRSAVANLKRSTADLEQLKAKFQQAERDWQRAQRIGPSEALAQSIYDGYRATYEVAQANVSVGEAAIQQAKAALAQAEAVLRRAQRNLGYCTIKSPVKGVIIDRRVNIGQTVVASLNAPSLFLIAKDLTRMQVWVAVNEADIGKIHPGQQVTFTLDAFPGETFYGRVGKVRLNASMTQNVVNYTVEVVTDNSNGRLLPYLTANVQFELNRASGVLFVPNSALRWNPSPEQVAPELRKDSGSAPDKEEPTTGKKRGARPAMAGGKPGAAGVVWITEGPYVRPVRVRTGLTDGSVTELRGEGLAEGLHVVVGVQQARGQTPAEGGNPFTPKFMRQRSTGKSG